MKNEIYMDLDQGTDGTVTTEGKILNDALGLSGETGESADHIKKYQFQGHDLARDHLIKELGDTIEIMKSDIAKLKASYPHGFEADRSRNREA